MSSRVRRLVKQLLPTQLFRRIEPVGHLVETMLVNLWYGFPAHGMHVIGVTGTNGKTTTSFMIHRMLTEAGYDVALLSTVAYGVGENITPQTEHMTTMSAPLLFNKLRQFKKQGARWVVLETTSHALAQNRIWGVPYEIAVMTNITHEHLDYHGTFQRYLEAKTKLFRIANRHGYRFGVANADDEHANAFTKEIEHSVTYGLHSGDLQATDIALTPNGSSFTVNLNGQATAVQCHIPGEFNVYNSLAAIAVGHKLGLSATQIIDGLASLTSVEGRMATVDEGQPYSVVVDFAHTPDSFERLLSDARTAATGKLVVMFGSAGRRDEYKRAVQGEIAGKYADVVVVTEEDDRDVDGNEIMEQIARGAEKSGKVRDQDLFLRLDRSSAIRFAVAQAKAKGDTVMLLGKGHEKVIERADGEHPWDEMAEARAAIAATR